MSRDIRNLERWIQQHPRAMWFIVPGLAILLLELAILIRYILDHLL